MKSVDGVDKKGNYVFVDTNHALTLDWFWSPRGQRRATASQGRKLPHLRCWSLNAERTEQRAQNAYIDYAES